MALQTPLQDILRTTSTHLKRLKELGIETVQDFLLYFPRRYADEREMQRIADIKTGEVSTIRGRVTTIAGRSTFRKRMRILTALIGDETGSVEAVWFNQKYLEQIIHQGSEVILSGKPALNPKKGIFSFKSPQIEPVKEEQLHTARIVPIYPETELDQITKKRGRLSSKWIREKLFPLMYEAKNLEEFLPENLIEKYRLTPYSKAVKKAHFPESEEELEEAKRRLAFNELFLLQLAALHRRARWRTIAAKEQKQIPTKIETLKTFTESLPWPLTAAQKKTLLEILCDMEKPYPMSRLVEGDTGSGKTVVAAAALLNAVANGFQACLIAPTEILARQHRATLSKLMRPFDIQTHLLIGAGTAREKEIIRNGLRGGDLQLVVGTHALLTESTTFKNLGLVVIDEQHRFGVRQREYLKTQGSPHVLSLTATPIPRTLALVLYGDQDLSLLDEMPPGRQTIMTRIVPDEKRADAYSWIRKQIEDGRQAFIIFPLIEESEALMAKAATVEYERLSSDIFPELSLGLLHGQMRSADKERVMKEFAEGKTKILVSTAVVEVGVDVPNATIMMIESAERFGLAQLHQFRGRVGRGEHQSYCLLFPTEITAPSLKRLGAMAKHSSGFKLAEIDMTLRGPGEVYGTAQSGIPDLTMASLSDAETIKESREAAEAIISEDPSLSRHPLLQHEIARWDEKVAVDY
ncbi:DNA helicase RecG [Candidatus Peregrinibacteria bacterium CG_4_9_14_0_2_um_filter_53_11]|nr:MAG: DNA helicase RecG [Candidatus Peregrinibacteria bacterium CG_4_9_14_0_2_um_filter_53_11]